MNNQIKQFILRCIPIFIISVPLPLSAQVSHIYLANDNHTDLFWTANATDYESVPLNEIDYHLDLTEATMNMPVQYQNRYNMDCAWYAYTYKKHRTPEQFQRLIDNIQSGHMNMPLNWLVSTYGGQPTEAVLRGMYWTGRLERDYDLDINLVASIENQTQPLGLASLWAGSGAKYSWKGVCGCVSEVDINNMADRKNEIYQYTGLDGSSVLMKWYSLATPTPGGSKLGGYAEITSFSTTLEDAANKVNTTQYPYNIVGAFGHAGDFLELMAGYFPELAEYYTNASRQLYVSNEVDFFEHFESAYDVATLPSESVTYGNEWDLNCVTLAPITAKIRNSVEKLRTAEALASVLSIVEPDFYASIDEDRENAWMALGSYWDHNFGLGGCCYPERNDWHIMLQEQVTDYVNNLQQNALEGLAQRIPNDALDTRFFVFNSLGWQRSDYADIVYSGDDNIKIVDVKTNLEVPFQVLSEDPDLTLRIYAENIPAVGYRVYEIQKRDNTPYPNTATLTGNVFENEFYQITFTSEGVITSLIDKQNGNTEYVEETNGRYLNDFGQGGGDNGTVELINNGPVSATIACSSANPLQHTSYITLFKTNPRIDIRNLINQSFGDDIRTYSFSFDLDNPTLWHEELGAILKAKYTTNGGHYATPDNPIRHDWQSLNHFADIGNNQKRVTLSNSGAAFMKLGESDHHFLDENSSQINVMIGGLTVPFNNDGSDNQFGLTKFENSFAIHTYAEEFNAANSMKFAMEHQNPLLAKVILGQAPMFPSDTFSLVKISDPHVLLWAIKPSEEGIEEAGLIARVWNMASTDQPTTLDFNPEVLAAQKTTHLETDIHAAAVEEGNLFAEIGQQRLETFRIYPDTLVVTSNPSIEKEMRVQISPNPVSTNKLKIEIPNLSKTVVLKVFTPKGQLVLNKNLDFKISFIDLKTYPTGVYLFSFESEGKRTTKKVLITN
jgi:alpha-mannosidase